MLAAALRFFLLIELAAYMAMAMRLFELSVLSASSAALALLLGSRAGIIAVTYVFAVTYHSPAPRLGFLRASAMVLTEYLAFLRLFLLIQPFERLWMGADHLPPGRRVLLLIHGFGCNRGAWWWLRSRLENGGYAVATLNLEPPYIEIDHYVAAVAARIEAACIESGVDRVTLVGHSMGGLLARSATEQSRDSAMAWPAKTRMIICLGSPQLGSPVERLGHLTTTALAVSRITRPLAKLAANRSQGIQDLRHGPGRHDADTSEIAWRFIGGSLSEDPDNPLGTILGDGLVTPDSATAHALQGDVASVRLGGIGHMQLLTAPRVYAQILSWLPV